MMKRNIFNNEELEVITKAVEEYIFYLDNFSGNMYKDGGPADVYKNIEIAEKQAEIARRILERIRRDPPWRKEQDEYQRKRGTNYYGVKTNGD